jgi:hypothetical protein
LEGRTEEQKGGRGGGGKDGRWDGRTWPDDAALGGAVAFARNTSRARASEHSQKYQYSMSELSKEYVQQERVE